jgi:hypothetical protein
MNKQICSKGEMMRKKSLFFFILFNLCLYTGIAEISSLSQIFLLGKGIKDLDGDNVGDRISIQIIIPSVPSVSDLAVAAEIAARANLESLAQDFSLVKKESEIQECKDLENLILIGSNLKLVKELQKHGELAPTKLKPYQGLVTLFSHNNMKGVALIAGSKKALLHAGRSFFLRWPYLWEIWGREEGVTYVSLEKDILKFLEDEDISIEMLTIKSALYEFPPLTSIHESLKRLKFNPGEIKNLTVEIDFSDKKDKTKALEAFQLLQLQHTKGQKTDVLSYPGCAQITFKLKENNEKSQVILHRLGYPKRILTPSYKPFRKVKSSGKDFDLVSIFSERGFYSDSDKDKILDNLDTCIIIPQDSNIEGIIQLASRLVLHSAGSSFPLVLFDSEIEEKRTLLAPILIGSSNKLNKELLKTGKLKIPQIKKGWGIVKVVPKAFNKSNALAITGNDTFSLEKTLLYFSQNFPYFDVYKEGRPQIKDVFSDIEEFLKGKKGSAEAYFHQNLKKITASLKEKNLEYFEANFYLPQKNQKFEERMKEYFEDILKTNSTKAKAYALNERKTIFDKEKEFSWEADEALALIKEKLKDLKESESPLKIEIGISESAEVRKKIKTQIEDLLHENDIRVDEVVILSAYKQGFFWMVERVLPSLMSKTISRLVVKFAPERDDFNQLKRFYSESYRWQQELYPVDEILSRELQLPLQDIEFQMKEEREPVYEVLAYAEKDELLLHKTFSPRRREIVFMNALPEWGKVTLTTGWVKIEKEGRLILDTSLKTDLERFWDYYQEEVLAPVYSYILKKTEGEPLLSKQPYFKRLLIEMWFSEPDYKLELDEEIVSSLESIHDEIYFDTLDFLRGITDIKAEEEKDLPEDTSRISAPGNVLPLIHPSLEGGNGRVKIIFEDWLARSPRLELKWKEKGKEELRKKIAFPSIKVKSLRIPSFIFNAQEDRVENLLIELKIEKEAEYLNLIEIIDSLRELQAKDFILPSFTYPKLKSITLKIKHEELEKEENLPVSSPKAEKKIVSPKRGKIEAFVPTDKIISPQMCLDIVERLGQNRAIRAYIGGISYENRKIPVLEIFSPLGKYVSLPRLITFKPTLYLSGRQHANEVSATNYILKLAEFFSRDKTYQEYLKKMNIVLHPLENPDGADLAHKLQKLTPSHSLHAGRYTSLGIDVGYQVNVAKPLLPEAKVRGKLYNKWKPDIYLNLHGYPSHEWVQQFSNYSPYLFRDYWIPRGWFVYYRTLRLPLYQKWKEAGDKLREFIIKEMISDEKMNESNKKFYDRYFRWAARWQPHMDYLEIYDNLNLYTKRRSSRESRLSSRRRTTFAEATPELMDETAHGEWLDFLCQQGLTYLRAHLRYLAEAEYEIARIEEEVNDRIRIQFSRSRPGSAKKESKK